MHGDSFRLPFAVRPIFESWVQSEYPEKADRILGLIRSTRGGRMNNYEWKTRMRGEGHYAEGIRNTFQVFRKKAGLDQPLVPLDTTKFSPPQPASGQMRLF